MFLLLGHLGDSIHEINRIREIIKFESALDMFLFQLPLWNFLHPRLQLVSFHEISHMRERVTPQNRFATANQAGFLGTFHVEGELPQPDLQKRPRAGCRYFIEHQEFFVDSWPNRKPQPHTDVLASSVLASSPEYLSPHRPHSCHR